MSNIHGWLTLYKPSGITSARAVAEVKRVLKIKKLGHAGTLDPMAEGVLPLALNEATKTAQYVVSTDKQYTFDIKWGQATDTDDAEGQLTFESDVRPNLDAITAILPQFTGDIQQCPPIFSALKIDGRRAYKLARQGKIESMPARSVQVFNLQIISHGPDVTRLQVTCGKGTYVRSLARDIAASLHTYGHVSFLRRDRVGRFHINDAIFLANLGKLVYEDSIHQKMVSIFDALDDIPAIKITPQQATDLQFGRRVEVDDNIDEEQIVSTAVLAYTESKQPIGIVDKLGAILRPRRLFKL